MKVFRYIPDIDAFVATDEYKEVARLLGIEEWTPVVWIGRLFCMDNDFGEHIFDNWDERELVEAKQAQLGITDNLLIVVPERFTDARDGPCHSPEQRKRFWTDVFKSLDLSLETIFEEARAENQHRRELTPGPTPDDMFIADLEDRIAQVRARYNAASS
jgi:hypothetical protein